MARSSSSSSSSSSGSPAAKRTAIAPKTQRASTSAAAASSKHNAVALASLADALPDQTANLPTAASSSNEPSLGDRINQSHANGKRLLNNNLQRKQQQQQGPLINGSASHPHDDDHDDEDAHHVLAPSSSSSKFLNGKLNGSTTRSTGAAGDPDLLTLLQHEGVNEAQHDNDDDLSPFPLPSSNPLSSSPALSHALTQALHSADTALLSSILSHSDPLLVRSTVQRLSGARALSLLEHCVSRLVANPTADARARGTATGKVRTNVEWIRAILVIHTSYLMALPHLTTKLASLHMALSTRLASHQRLLALQGRLDLVLSQIEMRSAYAAAAGVSEEKAGKRRKGTAIQGVSSKLAGANAAAAAAAVAGQKKGSKRQLGEDDPTRWVEPSDDEDDEQNDENLQPTPNNTMDVDVDPSSDDDEEEDSDEDDNDEDDEEEEEQYEELSPVDPASELEDDSDIEDIMLGPGFSSSTSPRANGTAKSRRRRILEDSEDGGDTTADSGPDDDDDGDADDDDLQYGGLASAMRARGMAQRLAEAAKQTSALNTGGASASGLVKGPGSEDLVAVKGRRGKRGAGAVAEQAPAQNGKAVASSAKASKMDLDDDDEDEEDDESLLDDEGDSDLEDDDEEDDDDHADYGMADMEAESTDGDGEEDDDDEEEED
ncbi:Small subunit (SSU) processome component [Tilletia horrida]|nr:Small subunit (SSU) processome component [Tilletia horrida]KAK0564960.1 Small subunit (SSU) processome component [Tilletia horrida]